jgi:hypothetical protein
MSKSDRKQMYAANKKAKGKGRTKKVPKKVRDQPNKYDKIDCSGTNRMHKYKTQTTN